MNKYDKKDNKINSKTKHNQTEKYGKEIVEDANKTKHSGELIKPIILDIRDKVSKLSDSELIRPNFRVYKSPNARPKSDYCYCSLVMIDDTYIPGALTLAYSLLLSGAKFNIICMVQDTHNIVKIGNKNKSTGVSKDSINALLELYDYVYGVDIIQVDNYISPNSHFTRRESYVNISLYATKVNMYALTDYKKVLYLDASCYIKKNPEFVFSKFNKPTFCSDLSYGLSNVGLSANVILVIPGLRYYTRAMLMIKKCNDIFGNLFFSRGIDEIILYYAVYPDWSDKLLDNCFKCSIYKYFQDCYVFTISKQKPFKKGTEDDVSCYIYYEIWDRISDMLLRKNVNLKKYYSHISTFRTHAITSLN